MTQDAQAGVTKRIRRRRGGPRTGQSGAALFASGEREQRSRSARRRIGIPSGVQPMHPQRVARKPESDRDRPHAQCM
ncbi:hypothetical protein X992_5462 [Burkholderia pseudomallei MSHR5492]|nr:hypothetical protein X992_5462 [Burkholderia pseudomallei MSHR5492]